MVLRRGIRQSSLSEFLAERGTLASSTTNGGDSSAARVLQNEPSFCDVF